MSESNSIIYRLIPGENILITLIDFNYSSKGPVRFAEIINHMTNPIKNPIRLLIDQIQAKLFNYIRPNILAGENYSLMNYL